MWDLEGNTAVHFIAVWSFDACYNELEGTVPLVQCNGASQFSFAFCPLQLLPMLHLIFKHLLVKAYFSGYFSRHLVFACSIFDV